MTHQLSAHGVSLDYGGAPIIADLSVDIRPGAITSIVGPNGCGKSTLLRSLARLLRPASGSIVLDGADIAQMPTKLLARSLGLLPQTPSAPEGITVGDLVGRGRTPHQGLLGRWSQEDYDVVAESMDATGVTELAERPIDELSGGQRQRVWIAMALAQRTDILLLDEPTTYLDIKHQLDILDLVCELNEKRGTTIVMVIHDLNMAARYSHELIALRGGAVRAQGSPREVITEDTVRDVFGIESVIIDDPVSGLPAVMPRSTR
ncbi:ABC transporter ATP-binding protein [Corynebacterium sp.]|uniref:ABC transporter ATP-binding protein n=1 Tax=Corynebacterium sp. TaxID=1720 RepID=UPI0026DBD1F7|nr:ABC transporter ATP-binding protein [Corynebacterium sp.]MDO5031191.1 ABC transporter ATP-binding protein [Corynebacterium sp.]